MPYNAGLQWTTGRDKKPEDGVLRTPPIRGQNITDPTSGRTVGSAATPGSGGDASRSDGFVNFGTWLGLNKGGADAQAQRLQNDVASRGNDNARAAGEAESDFSAGVASGTNTFKTPTIKTPPAPPVPNVTTPPPAPVVTTQSPGLEATPTKVAASPFFGVGVAPGGFTSADIALKKPIISTSGPGIKDNTNTAPAAPPVAAGPAAAVPAGGFKSADSALQTTSSVAALGAKEYTGPSSLAEQNPGGWAKLMEDARRNGVAANNNVTQEGRQAELSKVYGTDAAQMGAPTSYNSRLDAAMAGVAGGDALSKQKAMYGNQAADFEARNANSATTGANAKASSDRASMAYREWLRGNQPAPPKKAPGPIVIGALPGAGTASSTIGAVPGSQANGSASNAGTTGTNGFGGGTRRELAAQWASQTPEWADAITSMNDAEYADWQRGTEEGDPFKYLGATWKKKYQDATKGA